MGEKRPKRKEILTTALVTGGNRGLGFEVARQLAAQGMRVLLTSRGPDGERAAARLQGTGVRVVFRPLDVTSDANVAALVARLEADGERLRVVVNNAGISLDGLDPGVVDRTFAVNVMGLLRASEALVPLIDGGGRIVQVSSQMGELEAFAPALRARFLDPKLDRDGLQGLLSEFRAAVVARRLDGWPRSAYRVSKAAVNAYTRILAAELAPRVTVAAVCPGWCRTDMGGRGAPRSAEAGARSIVWAALDPKVRPGSFTRDGRALPW